MTHPDYGGGHERDCQWIEAPGGVLGTGPRSGGGVDPVGCGAHLGDRPGVGWRRGTAAIDIAVMVAVLVGSAVGMSPGWDSLALYSPIAVGAWVLGDLVRRC